MSPPISPRHRPPADSIPDGMSLLYADLSPKPEPPRQRARIELALVGALAAAGAAAAGSGLAGDLMRRFVRPATEQARDDRADESAFMGVERVVGGAPLVAPPLLAPVPESEFAPAAAGESALAEIEADAPAPALPPAAAPPRDMVLGSSRPAPLPTPATTAPTTSTTAPPTPTTAPVSSTTTLPVNTTTTTPPADPHPGAGSPVYVLAVSAGYEMTPSAASTIAAAGFEGWVDQQLTPAAVPDPFVDDLLAGFELLDRPIAEVAGSGLVGTALSEARWADFARSAFSERQIETQMASLWRDWFALPADDLAAQLEVDQAARHHAVGRYADLVGAVVGGDGLWRAHGLAERVVDDAVDSSLAERVLVDWVFGPDAPLGPDDLTTMAEALVAGEAATAAHVAALMDDPFAVAHVGAAIGAVVGGEGSSAAAAAVAGFGRAGHVGDAVRAALVDGGVAGDRPATAATWLLRSLRRANATVTIGGPWDPDDDTSIPGLLRLLGARAGDRPRTDADERTPAVVAARWEAARTVAGGGPGIDVDLSSSAPPDPLPAGDFVDHLSSVVDITLAEHEQQAVLDYLGVGGDGAVHVEVEPFIDLCALAMTFPTALRRAEAAA